MTMNNPLLIPFLKLATAIVTEWNIPASNLSEIWTVGVSFWEWEKELT